MVKTNYRNGGTEGRPTPKNEWMTPLEFYQALDKEFDFQLDAACSSINCLAPNGLMADRGMDGLMLPWAPGPTWCNPPYSNVRPWVERAALFGRETSVVMLIPADTCVRWWVECVVPFASEVRFVVGRLMFLAPEGHVHKTKSGGGGSTTPSAVVVYNPSGGPVVYSYIDRKGVRVG